MFFECARAQGTQGTIIFFIILSVHVIHLGSAQVPVAVEQGVGWHWIPHKTFLHLTHLNAQMLNKCSINAQMSKNQKSSICDVITSVLYF